jgi:hypothetical protein
MKASVRLKQMVVVILKGLSSNELIGGKPPVVM